MQLSIWLILFSTPKGVTWLYHPFGIIIPGDAGRYNHGIPSGF